MSYWFDEDSRANARGSSRQLDFMMDSSADLPDLPTTSHEGKPMGDTVTHKQVDKGSSAFSIAEQKIWFLDSNDQWVTKG